MSDTQRQDEPANDPPILAEAVTLDYARPTTMNRPPSSFWLTRTLCVLFAVVCPLVALFLNAKPGDGTVPIDWQNGEPLARWTLVTVPAAGWPLWPFHLFAWFSMHCAAIWPALARDNRLIRAGLFFGIAIGIEFTFVVAIGMADGNPRQVTRTIILQAIALLGAAIALSFAWSLSAHNWFSRFLKRNWQGLVIILIVIVVFGGLLTNGGFFFAPLLIAMGCIVGAAPISIVAYLAMLRLGRRPEFVRRDTLPLNLVLDDPTLTTIARRVLPILHVIAWFVAFLLTGPVYDKLPTSQPQYCFVATAAASSKRSDRTGHRQLRTLRVFENWLIARRPMTHAAIRSHYNRIGPRLASCITSSRRADIAHRALTIVEAAASRILRSA